MRKYRINADSWTELLDILVGKPTDFNSNRDSLRGRNETMPRSGRMTTPSLDVFMGHRQAGAIDYVIYSYDTPIAYRISVTDGRGNFESRWIVLSDRYSVTTSKHQHKVRTALSQISGSYIEI